MTEMQSRSAGRSPDAPDLRPPGTVLPLGMYLALVWKFRHYVSRLARNRMESRTAETALGRIWDLLEPLLMVAVYGTFFGVILGADRGVDNFIAFLAIGQIMFRFHSQGVQEAAGSMTAFEGQIQGLVMPRAVFPLVALLSGVLRYFAGLAVMLVVLFATGEVPSISWVLFPVIVLAQVLLNVGLGFLLARAVAHVRDLRNLLAHVFRILLYASGVVFLIEAYLLDRASGPLMIKILAVCNPLYGILALARWVLLDMRPAFVPWLVTSIVVWALVVPVVGALWFRRVEQRYGFGLIRNAP